MQIYDFGQTTAGHHFFVMEFIDGTDLHQFIRSGELDAEGALNAVSQICDALEYAHSEGYVHRDIKPANIFINSKGVLKVGDFGLAKLVDAEGQISPEQMGGLTMTGVGMGTPHYAAPEQMTGKGQIDHRADIFSLGIMFYEMLTGDIPRGAVKAPSQRMPAKQLDVRIDGVVFKAMEQDPDERYQTATDLRSDVDEIRTTDPPAAEKSETRSPKSEIAPKKKGMGPLAWAALVGLLVLVAGGAVWFLQQKTGESSQIVADSTDESDHPVMETSSTIPDSHFTQAVRPGKLRAIGSPIDLSAAEPFDDFIQVELCGIEDGKWIALRQNGQIVASQAGMYPSGLRDVAKMRRVRTTHTGFRFFFVLRDGSIRGSEPKLDNQLPASLKPAADIATAYVHGGDAYHHGLALHPDGSVSTWGTHYEDKTWKRPPAEALRDIVAVAAAHETAATIGKDGRMHFFGAEEHRVFQPEDGGRAFAALGDYSNPGQFLIATDRPGGLFLRDPAGEIKPIGITRFDSQSTVDRLSDPIWCFRTSEGWAAPSNYTQRAEVDALLAQIPSGVEVARMFRTPPQRFAAGTGVSFALWIEPNAETAPTAPDFDFTQIEWDEGEDLLALADPAKAGKPNVWSRLKTGALLADGTQFQASKGNRGINYAGTWASGILPIEAPVSELPYRVEIDLVRVGPDYESANIFLPIGTQFVLFHLDANGERFEGPVSDWLKIERQFSLGRERQIAFEVSKTNDPERIRFRVEIDGKTYAEKGVAPKEVKYFHEKFPFQGIGLSLFPGAKWRYERITLFRLKNADLSNQELSTKNQEQNRLISEILLAATKDNPAVNSLGMKFVPVPIIGGPTDGQPVLFSVYEILTRQCREFGEQTGVRVPQNAFGNLPCALNHTEAVQFAEWLTKQERERNLIPQGWRYRLPTDHEWSCGAQIGHLENFSQSPDEKNGKLGETHQWKGGSGNFENGDGHTDPHEGKAGIGEYAPNTFGLYDFGGNAWEWISDSTSNGEESWMRGGGANDPSRNKDIRLKRPVSHRSPWASVGFRLVLAPAEGVTVTPLAHSPEPPKVAELTQLLERTATYREKEIEAPFRADLDKLATGYLGGLERAIGKAADSGDLTAVNALRAEKTAVEAFQTQLGEAKDAVPNLAALPESAPDSLKTLRDTWSKARQGHETKRNADLAKFEADVETSLRNLEAELTKQRRFDDAKAVKAYREGRSRNTESAATGSVPAASAKAPLKLDRWLEDQLEDGGKLRFLLRQGNREFHTRSIQADMRGEDWVEVRTHGNNIFARKRRGQAYRFQCNMNTGEWSSFELEDFGRFGNQSLWVDRRGVVRESNGTEMGDFKRLPRLFYSNFLMYLAVHEDETVRVIPIRDEAKGFRLPPKEWYRESAQVMFRGGSAAGRHLVCVG